MELSSYQTKLNKAQQLYTEAQQLENDAEAEKLEEIQNSKDISKWVGYNFQSSSVLTEEFALFSKHIRAELKKINGYELVSYNRGHFYFSAFLKNKQNSKLVYISSDDVRGSSGWYSGLLIRTAQHDKDYTGGRNNFCQFNKIKEQADYLLR